MRGLKYSFLAAVFLTISIASVAAMIAVWQFLIWLGLLLLVVIALAFILGAYVAIMELWHYANRIRPIQVGQFGAYYMVNGRMVELRPLDNSGVIPIVPRAVDYDDDDDDSGDDEEDLPVTVYDDQTLPSLTKLSNEEQEVVDAWNAGHRSRAAICSVIQGLKPHRFTQLKASIEAKGVQLVR